MRINVLLKPGTVRNPSDYPPSTVFYAKVCEEYVIILKIHNSLYVRLSTSDNGGRTMSWNARWSESWTLVCALQEGESFTVTV